MTCSIRRALGVAVVAAAGGAVPVTAQQTAPPPPQVTVGGVVYGQYLYQLKDSLGAGDQNQFSIQRAYINLVGRFPGGLQTRGRGGLRLTGYAGVGKHTGGGDRNRFLGMLSYRSKQFTLAGEFAATKDTISPAPLGANTNPTGRVISGFGVYHVPRSGVALIARVDVVDPNTSASGDRQTRVIGGISYQVTPNLRVLADVDNVSYESSAAADLDTQRSRGLFQMQFTC